LAETKKSNLLIPLALGLACPRFMAWVGFEIGYAVGLSVLNNSFSSLRNFCRYETEGPCKVCCPEITAKYKRYLVQFVSFIKSRIIYFNEFPESRFFLTVRRLLYMNQI